MYTGFERSIGMASSYEQRVLAQLQHDLLERNPQIGQGEKQITIDEVRLEQGRPEGDIVVILFREAERPQCVFGFRAPAHEPTPQLLPDGQLGESDDPEGWAFVIMANLREHIEAADMGLPEDCDPNDITWIA